MNASSSLLFASIGGPLAFSFFEPPMASAAPPKAVPRVAMASYSTRESSSQLESWRYRTIGVLVHSPVGGFAGTVRFGTWGADVPRVSRFGGRRWCRLRP